MRSHTFERNRKREALGENDRVTQTERWEKESKPIEIFLLLLGVVEFIFVLQHSFLSSLHHVPLDCTGSDGINQVNDWQTGADQFVLQRTVKWGQMHTQSRLFDTNTICMQTNIPWSCWSVSPCVSGSGWCWPSWGWSDLRPFLHRPNRTKPALCTWRITSRTDNWSCTRSSCVQTNEIDENGQSVFPKQYYYSVKKPHEYLLISCQTSARVCMALLLFMFSPPIPTREKWATSLPSSTA